eukprot:6254486-Amphidinium_carterae.1
MDNWIAWVVGSAEPVDGAFCYSRCRASVQWMGADFCLQLPDVDAIRLPATLHALSFDFGASKEITDAGVKANII